MAKQKADDDARVNAAAKAKAQRLAEASAAAAAKQAANAQKVRLGATV